MLRLIVDRSVINLVRPIFAEEGIEGRTTFSSRALAARKALKSEPGSKASETARFLQLLARY